MGNWYGTVALLLAIAVFVGGVRIWERRATLFAKSAEDRRASASPQFSAGVDGSEDPPEEGAGRGSGRAKEEGPEEVRKTRREEGAPGPQGPPPNRFVPQPGVRGTWIKVAARDRSHEYD